MPPGSDTQENSEVINPLFVSVCIVAKSHRGFISSGTVLQPAGGSAERDGMRSCGAGRRV